MLEHGNSCEHMLAHVSTYFTNFNKFEHMLTHVSTC